MQLGWLDTNIFLHSLFHNDPQYGRCREILAALEDGSAEGWIDPVIVHELTYALPRHPSFSSRQAIQGYIRNVLLTAAIHADDKEGLIEAVALWDAYGIGFADSWLRILAGRRRLPVCSANRRHFVDVGNTF
mgnify:CR=1 FL=1